MPRATKQPSPWFSKKIAVTLRGGEWLALLNVLEATARPLDRAIARHAKIQIIETLARDIKND